MNINEFKFRNVTWDCQGLVNVRKHGDKVYIGQTSRALKSRTREHKRAIFTGDRNSLLTQHYIKNNHDFDLDDIKIIDCCYYYFLKRGTQFANRMPLMNTFTFLTFTRP